MDKRVLKMAGMLEGWRGVAGIVLGTVFGSWAASSVSVQASYTDATPGWGTTAFATLQSAVDAVEAGGTVYVFAGTYTAPVTLSKPVVLQGEGRGKSILEFSVSQGAQPVKLSAAGCVLTGFEIVKTDKLGPQNLIYVAADDVVVSNCFIRGQYVLGDGDVSRAFEVAHGCSRLLIDANEICALRQPGYLNGSTAAPTTGTVSNNRVSATRGWVIAGANVCFTGNTWGCGAQANYLDIAILSGTAAECYTNIPALCADNGGAVVQDQRVSGANLSVAFVDAAAAAGGDGTPTSPVQTLPEGLGKVLAGGVVRLAPGTYSSGALTVAKAVSILGANAGKAGADLARVAETRIRNSKLTLAAAATVDGVEIYQTDDTPDAVLVQAGACLRNSVIRREGVNTGKIVRGVVTAVGTSGFAVERNLFTGDSSGGLFGGHKTWNTGFWLNGGAGRVSDNVFAVCRTAVNLDDFNDHVILADNVFRTCGSYVSIGGTTPVDGSLTIAGNAFSFDYAGAANPTLFNNSNVASTFKLNAVDNTFGGLATENLSDAQKVMIEACIYHRGRNGTKRGVVRFVAGEQVVVATNTTVQSAVDAAMAGDRVLLSTGAHVGEVQISKALRLNGLSGAVIEGQVTLDAENIEVAGVTLATDRQWKVTTRASIQSGIDAAAAGERVAIQSGPYSGHIDASEKSVALAVGASPGQAVITGNLTLTADDQLEMELNGTEPGSAAGFDQWVVNGTVALNGAKLAASLGFTPAAGRAFAILVNDGTDAVVGTFAGLAEGSAFDLGGVTFSITYAGGDGNDVVLTVLAPAEVFVDDDYSAEVYDQGVWGYSAFAKIQEAVDAAMDYGWVYVSEGTYTETLTVAKNLSIVGAGARSTIIDAAGAGRVLEISGFDAANHIETVVSGLTLAHGQAEDYGAGVFLSFANVAIHDSVIRNCNAALGGAIANFHEADRVILDGSTLHGNTAGTSAQGGAINMFGGLLALTNCTVSGNSANQGGGLYLEGTEFAFEHITVTTNTVSGRGALAGGIRFSGTGSMSHSIVAGNVGGADCYGAFGGEFNLTSGAPKLAALGDFGGPTPTHALLTNSPALNGGSPTAVAADQRGVPRSQGSAPDIGAFETVYNAYVDCAYTAESCDGHVWGQDAFASIQAAINAVAVGGTVNVAAGTFTEVITVNKRVSLVGAGSGADGTILSAPAAASTHLGVVNLTASGLSQESPILIENVRVSATACAGLSVGLFTEATGTSVEYVKLDNVKVYGTNTSPSTEQERGLYVDLTSTLKHLAVTDCAFDNLTYGWYFAKQVSVDASTVQYVTVTGTSYSHNNHKGVYAEKLSDATFTGCTVAGNGFDGSVLPSYFVPWMCGIDLNLKAGNYANLTFDSCAITDNALGGALHGVGIAVKARDDGSTYGPFPASCAGVSITGCTITGNERGVRIGEPGKNNAGPTEVEIENCVIAGNDKRYAGTDGSAYGGLINMSQAAVDADNNYWGDASGPAGAGDDVIAVGTGPVTPNPYFTEAALQNHAPYDMALSEAAVSENGAVGAVVGTLSTTDVDAGNTFTYALVEGAGADDNGAFAIDGEVLKTVTGFNFETKDSYSIRVRTTDSHVNNAGVYEAVFTITVTDVEETPVLGSVGNQSTAEDTLLAFAATATDSDGDPLTFAWTGVPAGATATDAGAFSWTPTQAQIGIYTLTVTVSDGTGRSDSEEFTITVTAVNDNPTVANALGDLNKQQDFGTTNIALASVFADAENDALAYTVAVTGDPVLSAAINGTTLTLTSAALARGTATVTVTATESGTPEHLFVSNVFTVTVKPVWNTTKNTFFDTIQAAIDAVATVANDVITVAAGTYSGNLTISKGIALRSVAGPATTILIGTGGAAVKAESNGVEITGFTIRNPSGTQGFYAKNRSQLLVSGNVFETIGTAQAAPSDAVCGVMVWCTSTAVDTVVIRDNVMRLIESKATTKSAHGVWIGDSTGSADLTGLLIQSNAISQVTSARGAYGIVIGHARPPANTGRTIGARILDNTFSDISGSWAHAIGLEGNTPNAVVSGNSIARLADLDSPAKPDAVGVMVETNPDAQTLTIASNSFTNMAYGVVNKMANPVTANGNYWGSATPDIDALVIGDVVTDSFYADAALADLRFYAVYVDDSFATESGNQFKTIQGGVDAVSPYGTVHVAAGAYAGVTLVKSVKLLGANAGVAGYGTRADESVVSSVVNMTGADTSVMIDGFKFAVTPHLMFGANLAESKQTADWTFQNNLVEASGAIYSEVGNVNLNWRDVVVTRNRFANMTSNAVITHNVRSLTATDNQFDTLGAGGNALVCQNITSLEVAGNSFSNIGWNAVQLVGAESVTITNNVCSNLGAEAFKLGGPIVSGVCSYNTIVGANTSKEIDVGGIRIRVAAGQPYNVAIIGNYIENSFNGLAVRNNDVLAGTAITVAQNTFVGNSNAGLYNGGTGTLAASSNFWGTAFGPSGTGFFGTGDAIVGPVAIASYYIAAPLTTLHYYDLYVDVNGIEDVNHFKTIQAAYAAANPGDTIHVADGGYTLGSTFTVAKQGLTITGTSSAAVSIDASARTGTAYGIHVAASDVTLEHFTLIPASYAGAGFPIHVSGTPGILSNITLRDIVIANSFRTPFDFNGVDNLVLDGLVATGADYGSGIGLSGCVGVTLTGCQTANNVWGGVRVSGSTDVEPDRASGTVNVNFASNTFAEVNALYIENDGLNSTVDATGYSYKITTFAGTTTYLEEGYTEAQAIAVALGVESTFPGLTVTGLYDVNGVQILFDGEMSTAVVYVDDDWTNVVVGAGVQKPGAPAGTYLQFGRNAFATIQSAVSGVDERGTVSVQNGNYKESNIAVSKPQTIIGQSLEGVVVVPASEDGNEATAFGGTYQHGFLIQSDDVTIESLTVNGQGNDALTAGKNNYRIGIVTDNRSQTYDRLTLHDVAVLHTYYIAILGTGPGYAAAEGHRVAGCIVRDTTRFYGILLAGDSSVVNCDVSATAARGIGVYQGAATITNNVVHGQRTGWDSIWNYNYGGDGVTLIRDNLITNTLSGMSLVGLGTDSVVEANVIDLTGDEDDGQGMVVWWNDNPITIQGNLVKADAGDAGMWVFHNENPANPVKIFNNEFVSTDSVSGSAGQGTAIFLTDDGTLFGDENGANYAVLRGNFIQGFARGIDVHQNAATPVGGRVLNVEISEDNTIVGDIGSTGIRVFESDPTGNRATADIRNNTASISGCLIGIDVDGGSAVVYENSLFNNNTAMRIINSGVAALDRNLFEGSSSSDNNTDLLISATAGTVTLGSNNAFAGDVNYIDNRSTQSFDLTANNTTFDEASPYAIENLVYHKVDDAALGLVRTAAGAIYVTQESGSIQRGIDAATAGETVYVGAGTFTERLIINKPLTLLGANANVPFGSRGAETSVQCTGALSGYPMMTVQADNVTINGFELYGPGSNNAITSENKTIGRSNLTFTFNHVHDIGTTRGSGNIYGFHYMLAGDTPSDIAVTDNLFENIGNATALLGHAGAIYFGQSISTGTLDDVLIERNVVQNVAVTGADKNCWGIVIGVGWNSTGTATDLIIRNNAVSGISGGYAAGIALGGNTPGARVSNNTVSDVTSTTHPEATAAVLVETNTGAGTSVITANDLSGATCGILNKTAFAVTAVSNWFGSATGPASDLNAGGIGAAVVNVGGGSVDASPWLAVGTEDSSTGSAIGFQPAADAGVFYLPASLAFTQQPGGAALGVALNPQPTVTVYDEIGQIATQFVGTVSLALEDKPGSGTLDGTKEKNATAGVVVFNDLSIGTDGGAGYTLLASASPLSIESAVFTINNPPPVLATMSPIFKPAGSSEFTLTVTGSGFVPSSQVTWNGAVRSTTYVSGSELRATIAASDVAAAGTAAVNVSSPTAASNGALTFTITAAAQASEVWVDDGWTGYGVAGGKTWGYDAFGTIQSAINGVAYDGIIHVNAGTYTEVASALSKEFDLIGETASDGSPLPLIVGQIAINHPGSDTGWRIENLRFRAGTAASLLSLKNVNRAAVANCVFDGAGRFADAPAVNGLAFETATNGNTFPTVTDCVFSNGLYSAITGIASDLTVSNCLIDNVKSGMNMRGSNLTVQDCEIAVKAVTTTDTYGIRYGTSDANSANGLNVQGCVISVNQNDFVPEAGEYHCAIYLRAGAIGVQKVSNCSLAGDIVNLSTSPVTLDASGNWWGSAVPADVAGHALADSVDYSPWLANGTDTDGGALGFKGDFSALWVDDNSPHAGTETRMQEAADLADSGGTVNVLAGTYPGTFTVAKPVTVLGPNAAISPNTGERVAEAILQGTTVSGLSESVALDTTGVMLRGLTFDNLRIDNYNSNAHELITDHVIAFNRFVNVLGTPVYLRDGRDAPGQYSTGVVVQDNRIESPAAAGSDDYNAGSGIIVMGAEALVIKDNVILSAAYNGIQLARCNGLVLQNNTATGCAQPALQIAQWNDGVMQISGNTFSTLSTTKAAVRLYGFTNDYLPEFAFTGNTIKDSRFGVQIGREDGTVVDINTASYAFSGNVFDNIASQRLVVYMASEATQAEQTKMDALFAQVYAPGSTAGLIATTPVRIYAAVPNPVWVDNSYTAGACGGHVWGYDAFTTIQAGVNAVAAGGTVYVASGTYAGVTLTKSVTLKGANAGVAGYAARGAETVILNSQITVGSLTGATVLVIDGFKFAGTGYTMKSGVLPLDAGIVFRNNLVDAKTVGDDAIQIYSANLCGDVSFTANKFADIGLNALVVSSVRSLTVEDNEFTDMVFNAVQLTGAGSINIASNRIDTTYNEAIKLGGPIGGGVCSYNTILNANTSGDGDRGGIRIRGVSLPYVVTIANNIISNSFNGVCVKDGDNLAGATILVTNNSLVDNSNAGIYHGGTGTLSAERNWFGNATGPAYSNNPGGRGDAVKGTGAVDFSPWLGDGTDTQPAVVGFQPAADTVVYYLPASLAFTRQPGGAALGEALNPQPVVTVYDEIGQIATQFVGTVSIAIKTNPGSGTLEGPTTVNATAGVAEFAGLSIGTDGGTNFTLLATASPLSVESAAFTIANPQPALSSMDPIFKPVNSAAFTLTVTGTGFVPSTKVLWNGEARVTTYVSGTQLTAAIPETDLLSAGTSPVTVQSPTADASAALTFTITPAAQASEVWVDDDWSGYGDSGDKTWGYNAFATIQDALNGVAQDGVVHVLSGIYTENASTAKRVKIDGALGQAGERLATLKGSLTIDNDVLSTDGLEVRNLAFEMNGTHSLTLFGVNGGLVENCAFIGNATDWTGFNAILFKRASKNGNSNILIQNCVFGGGCFNAVQGYATFVTIDNCSIQDVYEGAVNLQGGGNLVVQDSDIFVTAQTTGHAYCVRFASSDAVNLRVSGCDLRLMQNSPASGSYQAAVIVRALSAGDLKVENCSIQGGIVNLDDTMVNASGNWWGISGAAAVQTAANGGALVDYSPWLADGTDTDNGARGFKGDFSSLWIDDDSLQAGTVGGIQEGVNLATAGGTVNVLSGTYAEHVAIAKAVSVLGADKATTFIDGSADDVVVQISASEVAIKGFTVRNSGTDLNQHAGIAAVGTPAALTGLVIEDNIVTNNATGVALLGASATVQNNEIVNNARYGIVMSSSPYNAALLSTGNTVVGNTLRGNARDGIYCDAACSGNLITENWIGGAAGTHEEGQLTALEGNGIYLWGSSNNVVSCNEIVSNAVYGIEMMMGDGNIITNNVVTNNNAGICVRYGNSPQPFAGNEVHFNDVSGNTAFGIALNFKADFVGNKADYALNAENNWFGHLTGPEHLANPGGTGTATTDYVDFSPWLGDGTDTQPTMVGFQPKLTPMYYLPVGITFSTEPADALLGATLGTVTVQVTNEIGEVATQFNGSIALAIGNNPGAPVAGELSGTTNLVVANGVAIFDGLSIVKGTGDGYTLVASTLGLPAVTSVAFNIANSTPVLTAIGSKSVDEQAELTFTATATDTDADLVEQTLTFSLDNRKPEGASIDPATGVFTWTPTESQGGSDYTFTVVVTDNGTGALYDSEEITVTVNEVNVAPTITIDDTELEVVEQPTQALTFTATATDQDLPAQTLTFSLVAVDDQNYPTGATLVTTDAGDGTASGAFSWSPTEEQGGMTYVVDVVVTDNGTPSALAATQRVTIAVAEVNVAPELAGIPPQSAVFGQTLTFTASASDQDLPAQTLTYTMTGAPDGAELDSSSGVFTWTPTEAQAQNNYSFTVTVTDNGVPALFDEQVVTIGAITASHGAPGYRSPASLVVSNSIAFGVGLTSLAWSPELPAGWTVTAVDTLGNGEAAIEEDGTLTFTALPAVSPAVFTYTVSVPGDQAVSNLLCATVAFNGVTAQVEPLPLFRYHSADYRRDVSGDTAGQFRKIDSTEINRVLSYWRFGYKPDAAGYDGFSAAAGYAGTEAAHHSADTDKNWIVDGSELLRVQMYWRGGGYLVNLDTPDGYATDPYRTGSGPSLFALAGIPAAAQTAPSGYNPGETLQVTYTLDTAGASLLALGWAPELPAGWVIENVSGDAAPMFARNEIICGAAVLPTVTATVTVTVRVPLTETRTVTLGGAARLITDSGYGVESYAMESVTLAPVDGDSNGMADAWERTFAGAAGSLDPAADLDGDTMSNLNEYRCGTLPNDAASVLKMVAVRPLADGKMQVSWASVAGRTYAVQRAVGSPAAANFMTILTGIAADPTGRNVYVDDADGAQARFYRVVLQD